MAKKRVAAFFIFLPFICISPLIFMQLGGSAMAGLTAGFSMPAEHPLQLILFLLSGVVAYCIGGNALFSLPLAFCMMLLIGAGSDIAIQEIPASKMMMFSAVLMYAMAIGAGFSRQFVPLAAIFSAVGFYLGAGYAARLPEIAAMGWFLVGVVLVALLFAAVGMSLAMAGRGYWEQLGDKIKATPTMASFFSLF